MSMLPAMSTLAPLPTSALPAAGTAPISPVIGKRGREEDIDEGNIRVAKRVKGAGLEDEIEDWAEERTAAPVVLGGREMTPPARGSKRARDGSDEEEDVEERNRVVKRLKEEEEEEEFVDPEEEEWARVRDGGERPEEVGESVLAAGPTVSSTEEDTGGRTLAVTEDVIDTSNMVATSIIHIPADAGNDIIIIGDATENTITTVTSTIPTVPTISAINAIPPPTISSPAPSSPLTELSELDAPMTQGRSSTTSTVVEEVVERDAEKEAVEVAAADRRGEAVVDDKRTEPVREEEKAEEVARPKSVVSTKKRKTCVTCGRGREIKAHQWKKEKVTEKDQCRPCYDRAYKQRKAHKDQELLEVGNVERVAKAKGGATERTAEPKSDDEREYPDKPVDDAPEDARDDKRTEEKDIHPGAAGEVEERVCVTCGRGPEIKSHQWKKEKETNKPQCRRCNDRAYLVRKKELQQQALREWGNLPKSPETVADPVPVFRSRRETKAPVFYGEAITDSDLLAEIYGGKYDLEDDTPKRKSSGKSPNKRISRDSPRAFSPYPSSRPARLSSTSSLAFEDDFEETPKRRIRTGPPKPREMSSNDEGLRVQDTTCNSARLTKFAAEVCKGCITKSTTDGCRHQGIRWFRYSYGEAGESKAQKQYAKAVEGPFFYTSTAPDQEFDYPTQFDVTPTRAHLERIKEACSEHLLPILEKELEHARMPDTLRRPQETTHRLSCDGCATSLFAAFYHCKHCGGELCASCYEDLDHLDLTDETANYVSRTHLKDLMIRGRKVTSRQANLLRCRAHRAGVMPHYASDFLRYSQFRLEELENLVQEIRDIVARAPAKEDKAGSASASVRDAEAPLSSTSIPSVPDGSSPPRSIAIPAEPQWVPPADPAELGSHPVVTLHQSELDEQKFRDIWSRGEPFVVLDVLDNAQIQWTPDYFIEHYGEQECAIVDCRDTLGTPLPATVGDFFRQFREETDSKHVLKLKDWPPQAEFSQTFPELYDDFQRMVPMGNFTRRDGVYNIASHFPHNAVRPDLGPKMYCALTSKETAGGHGSTRLHMDIADAVNIMVHAEPQNGQEGCAVWDIFRAEDSETIRKFLREVKPGFEHGGDPIHAQTVYLDARLRRKLFERHRVLSMRIYQRPGEAVFIPAGCAHQVCNLSNAIKVAVDFVSEANIPRCAQLTREFRALNTDKVWKDDVLSLYFTMFFAFMSCRRIEKSLEVKTEELATELPVVKAERMGAAMGPLSPAFQHIDTSSDDHQ